MIAVETIDERIEKEYAKVTGHDGDFYFSRKPIKDEKGYLTRLMWPEAMLASDNSIPTNLEYNEAMKGYPDNGIEIPDEALYTWTSEGIFQPPIERTIFEYETPKGLMKLNFSEAFQDSKIDENKHALLTNTIVKEIGKLYYKVDGDLLNINFPSKSGWTKYFNEYGLPEEVTDEPTKEGFESYANIDTKIPFIALIRGYWFWPLDELRFYTDACWGPSGSGSDLAFRSVRRIDEFVKIEKRKLKELELKAEAYDNFAKIFEEVSLRKSNK